MRITAAHLYPLPFGFIGGGFTTAYGRRTHLNNLLLEIETDEGLTGYGEVCRKAGNTPEPADPAVARHCQELLARTIGADPLNIAAARADLGDPGTAYSNLASAFETACFDITGKKAGVPLWVLLGGRRQASVPIYRSISQAPPEVMAADAAQARREGCAVFQVKVGGHGNADADRARIAALLDVVGPEAVLLADANGGWDVATAAGFMRRFTDPRLYWEEPCSSYEENREAAVAGAGPVILDQCVTGPDIAARACADGVVAGLGIKCTMQGGLLAGRLSRDLAITHGLKLKVDDSWSADVASAASLHLALAVPPAQLLCSLDMPAYFDARISDEGPVAQDYRLAPGDRPGLGLVPDLSPLGPPLTFD